MSEGEGSDNQNEYKVWVKYRRGYNKIYIQFDVIKNEYKVWVKYCHVYNKIYIQFDDIQKTSQVSVVHLGYIVRCLVHMGRE